MREKIHCLLDANSIIKYYFDLKGSPVIKYLIEKSPTAIVNITTVQIAETISVFYKSCREGAYSLAKREEYKDTFLNDIKQQLIIPYDFVREHILDFDVYEKITEVCPPDLRPITVYIPQCQGFVKELKHLANTGDAIMLLIMREMHLLTDKKCYLFTSDGHVLKIARELGLKTINPERMNLNNLPLELDMRLHKRQNASLKIICKDCVNSSFSYGSTHSMDICAGGICIRQPSTRLCEGNKVNLTVLKGSKEVLADKSGTITRLKDEAVGIKFDEPIEMGALTN